MKLALHNHYWEYAEFGGRPAYHYFQNWVPEVEFEIDTYWAANFGARDPAKEVARVSERTPLIHTKDGPLKQNEPMVALGTGRMDIAGVIQAADGDVLEWCIVELDACATDMSSAIRKSHDYLAALS